MDLNVLKNVPLNTSETAQEETSSYNEKDIAIIGMSANIGSAKSIQEFWEGLCEGYDYIRDFPEERYRDAEVIYQIVNGTEISEKMVQCAYMDRIDLFDPDTFKMTITEAEFMNPVQRLFLETAWSALEDGGYAGDRIRGSATGIYLGYTVSDDSYGEALAKAFPEAGSIIVSGNVTSIIASRICHLLDLRGPAVVIDTACSSSLVALHTGSSAIRNGEIEMALVGGIRLMILPRTMDNDMLGVESRSARAKTFDISADGTGGGEGSICFLIKSARKAEREGDNIYAVIKGSAINQDGKSAGITAPNAYSQAEVIRAAWKDSGVNPSDISYIEAHGTGTSLGDPVEISGIERAFHYTGSRQFCSIGAVKTNVGHLDAAAGLVGLLKVVLMLNNKIIPPMIGFKIPNPQIDFISSPVYVSDRLAEWESNTLRKCGVSSFGISGTNCHVVVEEAKTMDYSKDTAGETYLITISGTDRDHVKRRLKSYKTWLEKNTLCSISDFCYSANVGRADHRCRFSAVFKTKEEFLKTDYDLGYPDNNSYFYREYTFTGTRETGEDGSLSQHQTDKLSADVTLMIQNIYCAKDSEQYADLLKNIASYYVQGAQIPWRIFYRRSKNKILPIPSGIFNHVRCMPSFSEKLKNIHTAIEGKKISPLINEAVKSYQVNTYLSHFNIDTCWELKEHKINTAHVMPGTAFIEMAHFIANDYWQTEKFVFENLVFFQPLSCEPNETVTVHSTAKQDDEIINIGCYSKNGSNWKCHMEVRSRKLFDDQDQIRLRENHNSIADIMIRCAPFQFGQGGKKDKKHIVNIDGIRWDNIEFMMKGKNELLIKFSIRDSLKEEKSKYYLYPALLDPAINAGNYLINDVYLPYSCETAVFYEPLPDTFYSHIVLKNDSGKIKEVSSFDITIYNGGKKAIGFLHNYTIKRVNQTDFLIDSSDVSIFHRTVWNMIPDRDKIKIDHSPAKTLIICRELPSHKDIQKYVLENDSYVAFTEYRMINGAAVNHFYVDDSQEAYNSMLERICENGHLMRVIFFSTTGSFDCDSVHNEVDLTLKSIFYLVKAILKTGIRHEIELILLTNGIDEVLPEDRFFNPMARAAAGMGLCVSHEYKNIQVKVIDFNESVAWEDVVDEINYKSEAFTVAIRSNHRYAEAIAKIKTARSENQELRKNGVYVIAGGLGGMGFAFCKYLFSQNEDIHIVLVNRTYSDEEISSNVDNAVYSKKLNKVRELLDQGFDVSLVRCDISDYTSCKSLFEEIRLKYGRIDGIIHSAGVPGDGFILNKDWATFNNVIASKIYGAINIHTLTLRDNLQFYVMCSSLTSLFGAPGQSDYTAANAFIDGFAQYRKSLGLLAVSLDWTGWNESGMAVNNDVTQEDKYVHFMNDSQGAQAMHASLSLEVPRVLVGKFNYPVLNKQMDQYRGVVMLTKEIKDEMTKETAGLKVTDGKTIDLSDLVITGKRMNLLSLTEINVIKVWAKTLHIKNVDIRDKFFEIGGNSLLAAYLHKELDRYYPGLISITDLFLYSTIEDIARFIDDRNKSLSASADNMDLIDSKDGDEENIKDLVAKFMQGELNIEDLNEKIQV